MRTLPSLFPDLVPIATTSRRLLFEGARLTWQQTHHITRVWSKTNFFSNQMTIESVVRGFIMQIGRFLGLESNRRPLFFRP